MISLILSDVVDDKMDIIASAPTVFDISSPQMCIDIFKELKIQKQVPASVNEFLFKKSVEFAKMPSLKKPEAGYSTPWSKFQHVKNVIVGNNSMATKAARDRAEELGLLSIVVSASLEGEARNVGELFVDIAKYIAFMYNYKPSRDGGSVTLVQLELKLAQFGFEKKVLNDLNSLTRKARNCRKGVCVVSGGETVVKVKGQGKGGRNQEMADRDFWERKRDDLSKNAFLAMRMLYFTNAVVNPFIYGFFDHAFRRKLVDMACKTE